MDLGNDGTSNGGTSRSRASSGCGHRLDEQPKASTKLTAQLVLMPKPLRKTQYAAVVMPPTDVP